MGESRADVEIGNEEEKEPLESEVPTVETNPKCLMRRGQQEREDCVHAVCRSWCAVFVRGRCVEKHLQVELLKEEKKERTQLPWISFDHVSVTQEKRRKVPNSDSSRRRTKSNERDILRTARFHPILHSISCRLENPFVRREWTENESTGSSVG